MSTTATHSQYEVSLVKTYRLHKWQESQYWAFAEDEGGMTVIESGWTAAASEPVLNPAGYYRDGDLEPFIRTTTGPDCDGTQTETFYIFRTPSKSEDADIIDNTGRRMFCGEPVIWYADFTDQNAEIKRDAVLREDLGGMLLCGHPLINQYTNY